MTDIAVEIVEQNILVEVDAGSSGVTEFIKLNDTPASYASETGKFLRVNATEDGIEFVVASITTDFLSLTDTPSSYTGDGGKIAAVNTGETSLEFVDRFFDFLSLTDSPSSYSGETGKVIAVNGTETGVEFITVSATPSGADGEIQFNDSGSFGADSNLNWDNVNKSLFISGSGTTSNPLLALRITNTGFIALADSLISIVLSGSRIWNFGSAVFGPDIAGRAYMRNFTPSATVPAMGPRNNDINSGMGSPGGDQVNLIVGGLEALRVEEGFLGTAGTHTFIPNVTTEPTINPIGGFIMYASGGAMKVRGSSGTVTTVAPA